MMRVILRADGNHEIGFGHVYRLIALAGILQNEFECVFATNCTDGYILAQINNVCSRVINIKTKMYSPPAAALEEPEIVFDLDKYLDGTEIIVIDGYWFRETYQRKTKSAARKLVAIDDLAKTLFSADVVINHAPFVDHNQYKISPYTKLCTGLEFAILRKPFLKPFKHRNHLKNKLYISLGGTDYYGITPVVTHALKENSLFEQIHIMVSNAFHIQVLHELHEISSNSSGKVVLHNNLGADQLVELLDDCTHAFVSASTVLIESYARGLQCITGYYTDNQALIYEGFVKNNMAGGIGYLNKLGIGKVTDMLEYQVKKASEPLTSDINILELFKAL